MKSLLPSLFLVLFIYGCSTSSSEEMNLTGTVRGLKKGTLYLQKFEDTLLVNVDSLVVDGNPDFQFRHYVKSPEIYFLYLRLKDATLKDDRITFFAENKDVQIATTLKHFGSGAVVTGSKNDSLLKEYNKLKQRYISRNLELIEKELKSKKTQKETLRAQTDEQQRKLLFNKYLATINFALSNKDYEVAPFVVLSEAYNANIKYLDTVYSTLSPNVKDSKYGKELESFINTRKNLDTVTVR